MNWQSREADLGLLIAVTIAALFSAALICVGVYVFGIPLGVSALVVCIAVLAVFILEVLAR